MQYRRPPSSGDESAVLLGILDTVGREGQVTQRTLAAELGIALGLINAYLKRCVKKGLIKVQKIPPRRYSYYLTPHGLAEKSRLAAHYLSRPFDFFRQARHDCEQTLQIAAGRGFTRVGLIGASDLAEIAVICAVEAKLSIVAVVDAKLSRPTFLGVPVVTSMEAIGSIDGAIVTDMDHPAETFAAAVRLLGSERVLIPELLQTALAHSDVVQEAT